MNDVVDNQPLSRFELEVEGARVIAEYRIAGDTIYFTHTETPARLQGRGLAGKVVGAALASAKARGLKIAPRCPYVADFVRRNPEYAG